MTISRLRDLSLLDTHPRLVIATDSIGGIGLKPHDVLAVEPEISGYFLARVPLVELVCIGANPISFILTSSNEMKPTGQAILNGVRQAFEPFSLAIEHENGSTEENMPTSMTAAGITVMGELADDWESLEARVGDWLYLIGWPVVGQMVLDEPERIVPIDQLEKLRKDPRIGVMIPLGSRGIKHELEQIGFGLEPVKYNMVPWNQSGGPATAVIFSAAELDLIFDVTCEVRCLGQLIR